ELGVRRCPPVQLFSELFVGHCAFPCLRWPVRDTELFSDGAPARGGFASRSRSLARTNRETVSSSRASRYLARLSRGLGPRLGLCPGPVRHAVRRFSDRRRNTVRGHFPGAGRCRGRISRAGHSCRPCRTHAGSARGVIGKRAPFPSMARGGLLSRKFARGLRWENNPVANSA